MLFPQNFRSMLVESELLLPKLFRETLLHQATWVIVLHRPQLPLLVCTQAKILMGNQLLSLQLTFNSGTGEWVDARLFNYAERLAAHQSLDAGAVPPP